MPMRAAPDVVPLELAFRPRLAEATSGVQLGACEAIWQRRTHEMETAPRTGVITRRGIHLPGLARLNLSPAMRKREWWNPCNHPWVGVQRQSYADAQAVHSH